MRIQVEETKDYASKYHERLINDLKDCAVSIADNAESIVGSEKYLQQVRVTITLNATEATSINIDRDFYPERVIEKR